MGLKAAGFSPFEFYEMDKHACLTLQYNMDSMTPTFDGHVHKGADITKIDWRDLKRPVRLLACGVPCQPFSFAGKHLAEDDKRNLFPATLRVVRELRPAAVLIENVQGLVRPDFKPYFDYVIRQLKYPSVHPNDGEPWTIHDLRLRHIEAAGGGESEYLVNCKKVNAADYGVPQNRHRVFVVATRAGIPRFEFPPSTHSRASLLRTKADGTYWERHGISKPESPFVVGSDPQLDGMEDGQRPWVTVRDAIKKLPEPTPIEDGAWMNHWCISGARTYAGHRGSTLDWPSKTIKAGVHGVPGGENIVVTDNGSVRYFTMRELACLQTFPLEHYFIGARLHITRQIGNAVPCLLAEKISRSLFDLLDAAIGDSRLNCRRDQAYLSRAVAEVRVGL